MASVNSEYNPQHSMTPILSKSTTINGHQSINQWSGRFYQVTCPLVAQTIKSMVS